MSSSPFCFLRTSKHLRQAPLYLYCRSQRGEWKKSWQMPLSACSKYSLTAHQGQFPHSEMENTSDGNYRTLAQLTFPEPIPGSTWLLNQCLALLNGARKEQCGITKSERQTDRQAQICSSPYHHWTGTEGTTTQEQWHPHPPVTPQSISRAPVLAHCGFSTTAWLPHTCATDQDLSAMWMFHSSASMAFY